MRGVFLLLLHPISVTSGPLLMPSLPPEHAPPPTEPHPDPRTSWGSWPLQTCITGPPGRVGLFLCLLLNGAQLGVFVLILLMCQCGEEGGDSLSTCQTPITATVLVLTATDTHGCCPHPPVPEPPLTIPKRPPTLALSSLVSHPRVTAACASCI